MDINIVEKRLDELIEQIELKPSIYFESNVDFIPCYSYFMYLKFGINVSEIEVKLRKHFCVIPTYNLLSQNRLDSVFLKPNFQEEIKMFRKRLENAVFE